MPLCFIAFPARRCPFSKSLIRCFREVEEQGSSWGHGINTDVGNEPGIQKARILFRVSSVFSPWPKLRPPRMTDRAFQICGETNELVSVVFRLLHYESLTCSKRDSRGKYPAQTTAKWLNSRWNSACSTGSLSAIQPPQKAVKLKFCRQASARPQIRLNSRRSRGLRNLGKTGRRFRHHSRLRNPYVHSGLTI